MLNEKTRLFLVIMGLTVSLFMVHVGMGMITATADESTRIIEESDYECYIMQRNKPSILMGGIVSDEVYDVVKDLSCVDDVDRIIDDWISVKYNGEETGVPIYGIDHDNEHVEPWNIVEGDFKSIKKNNTIILDKHVLKFFPDLKVGDKVKAGVLENSLKVIGFCEHTKRTGQAGGWTNFETGKMLLHLGNESTYLAVTLKNGFTVKELKEKLEDYDDEVLVYSREEMIENTTNFILFDTGLAGSIGIIALIGFVVAMIVMSITLYQSVSDKLLEFVSMNALGASKGYINKIIITQTIIIVSSSFLLATILAVVLSPSLSFISTLSVGVNPIAAMITYGISLGLGIFCSLFSIRKVHTTDPAIIFRS